MKNFIPYNKQNIDKKDIKIVSQSLKENLITTGKNVKKFELKIKNKIKSKYVVSCSSGTSALHLSLLSLNLKQNDNILMPAINFIAAYNMSKLLKLNIFLVDVDPISGQMTPETLKNCIKINKLKKIDVLITMFLGGYPENIPEFHQLKKKYNFKIIEDACHAFGSRYYYKKKYYDVGSCKHSDISTFSFHPVKSITTGEGGAISTNNQKIFNNLKLYRNHGMIKDKKFHWKYDIKTLGFNYRISDINCALGISQINKLNKFISKRKKIFDLYSKNLKKFVNLYNYNLKNKPSYHLFLISINFKKLNTSKDNFMQFMKKNKIMPQYHYIPIYKFGVYTDKKKKLKNAEYYFKNTISLPIYYDINLKNLKMIIKKIKFFLRKHNNITR